MASMLIAVCILSPAVGNLNVWLAATEHSAANKDAHSTNFWNLSMKGTS